MKIALVNRFDLGMVNDPRTEGNVCRVCSNFDALTNPHKLTPYHDSEDGDNAATTSQKQNFAVALRTGSTYSLYALGVQSGNAKAEVLYQDVAALTGNAWSATANNQSSSGSADFGLFTYYKKTGLIYSAKGGTTISTYDPTGAVAFDSVTRSIAYTEIGEGLVHSKDDIMYVPYLDNSTPPIPKLAKNDAGSWTDVALSLPTGFKAPIIAEQGNNIAIMLVPQSGVGSTRVFIWNRDSTLATLQETIDWGEGEGRVIFELDGILVGVSLYGANSTRFMDRVVFKYYNGSGAQEFLTLEGGTLTQLTKARQRIDNRLWFMMSITLNGSVRAGVWSIGRTASGWSLFHERTTANDTAFTTADNLKGFIKIGDYLFQSLQYNSTGFSIQKTNDQASYTATSIYETKVNPAMDSADLFRRKQLGAVAVFTENLTGANQVVMKYKVDGGSYSTALLTHTTSTKSSDGLSDVMGFELPNNGQLTTGREFEFRLESTGGAIITGFGYAYDDELKSPLFT